MIRALALLAALSVQAPGRGQGPEPVLLRAEWGRMLQLKGPVEGCRWLKCSDACDLIVSESARTAIFCAPPREAVKGATFRVFAVPPAGEPITFQIAVGQPEPPPGPPVPPGPGPAPPVDPLVEELQSLYAADPDPTKAEVLPKLAALYRLAARLASERDEAGKFKVQTVAEINTAVGAAAGSLAVASLKVLRDRVRRELSSLPSEPSAPLTEDLRKRVAALYQRLAACLEKLRP